MIKQSKGITLVSLTITIIIVLILAGISIRALTNQGLLEKAILAKEEYNNSMVEEDAILKDMEDKMGISSVKDNTGTSTIEIYLNNKLIDEIPDKTEKYILEDIFCTNDAKATFDTDSWKLTISDISTVNTVCKLYFTSDPLGTVLNRNIDNVEVLSRIFKNSNYMQEISQDEQLMNIICESQIAREQLYDNYEITQEIISNSEVAKQVMKNSNQYMEVTKSSWTRTDELKTVDDIYIGKAFLIELEYSFNSSGIVIGDFTDNTDIYNIDPGNAGGTSGIYSVNKFMSSIRGGKYWCYNDPIITYHFFKI